MLKLVRAEKKDIQTIAEFNTKLNNFYLSLGEKHIQNHKNAHFFLTEFHKWYFIIKDEKIIGSIKYQKEFTVATISSFYIEEEYRNQGIGTEVLNLIIEKAKQQCCKTVKLSIKNSNASVSAFYEKIGFKPGAIVFYLDF